jgi:hypothetical protein
MTTENYISSGRFIWKRFEHKRTEEGTSYSTEIIATAATELDAIDIVNRLNAREQLRETLKQVHQNVHAYEYHLNNLTARACIESLQNIFNNANTELITKD